MAVHVAEKEILERLQLAPAWRGEKASQSPAATPRTAVGRVGPLLPDLRAGLGQQIVQSARSSGYGSIRR